MAICEAGAEPMTRAEGRHIWSPREESGMGAPHEEHVTVGRTTEARSICCGRGARSDIRNGNYAKL